MEGWIGEVFMTKPTPLTGMEKVMSDAFRDTYYRIKEKRKKVMKPTPEEKCKESL